MVVESRQNLLLWLTEFYLVLLFKEHPKRCMGIAAFAEGGIEFFIAVFALKHRAHVLIENNALPQFGLYLGELFIILDVFSHSDKDLLVG